MKSKYGELYDWSFEELLPNSDDPDDLFKFNREENLSSIDHYQADLLPWCPLFGELPFCNLSSGQVKKCIDIIEEARDLWRAYFPNGYPAALAEFVLDNSWVESELLAPHFSKEELLLARNLFIEWEDIFRIVYQELRHPYKADNGENLYAIDLHDIDGDDLLDSFANHKSWLNFEAIQSWQVLSIIAIYEARKLLNLALYSHVPWHYYGTAKWCLVEEFENKSEIIKHVQNSKYILDKAKYLYNLEDIQRGKKSRADSQKAAEARREQIRVERECEWTKWRSMASEIQIKAKNSKAKIIREKLKKEGCSDLPSVRTIRNRI